MRAAAGRVPSYQLRFAPRSWRQATQPSIAWSGHRRFMISGHGRSRQPRAPCGRSGRRRAWRPIWAAPILDALQPEIRKFGQFPAIVRAAGCATGDRCRVHVRRNAAQIGQVCQGFQRLGVLRHFA